MTRLQAQPELHVWQRPFVDTYRLFLGPPPSLQPSVYQWFCICDVITCTFSLTFIFINHSTAEKTCMFTNLMMMIGKNVWVL